MNIAPSQLADLAIALVTAVYGLHGLGPDLVLDSEIESSGPDGLSVAVHVGGKGGPLRQRVWVTLDGRAVALGIDDQQMRLALTEIQKKPFCDTRQAHRCAAFFQRQAVSQKGSLRRRPRARRARRMRSAAQHA